MLTPATYLLMLKPALLFLILLLPCCLYAQRDSMTFKHVVSLAPLRLIDPDNSGVEAAYEYRYKHKLGTQLVAAYMTPAFSNTDHWRQYRGFRFGIDQRYYPAGVENHAFIAAGFVLNKSHLLNADTYVTATDSIGRYDTVHLHRTNVIFNITYGVQVVVFRRLTFDFSTGLGLKYRQIRQDEPGVPAERHTDWISSTYFTSPGHRWTIAFPLTIRLGYRF